MAENQSISATTCCLLEGVLQKPEVRIRAIANPVTRIWAVHIPNGMSIIVCYWLLRIGTTNVLSSVALLLYFEREFSLEFTICEPSLLLFLNVNELPWLDLSVVRKKPVLHCEVLMWTVGICADALYQVKKILFHS